MIDWIMAEGAGHCFFYAFPVCLIILLIINKRWRTPFLIPSIVISILIINPWFYSVWEDLGLYAYWRILWIVPVVPVLSAIIPAIYKRTDDIKAYKYSDNALAETEIHRKKWGLSIVQYVIVFFGIIAIVFSGSYVYTTNRGLFDIPTASSAKIPGDIVQIADRLLNLKDHPRVIAQYPIGIYIRQYTGDIDVMYGRDLEGYILSASSAAKETHYHLASNEFVPVAETMLNDGYDYLVVDNSSDERKEQLNTNGFELVDSVARYGIYSVKGAPTEIKQKNELGQITSITFVNEQGEPIVNENGYSTISYKYDNYGHIIREFYTDPEGRGVENNEHSAGYEREYDSYSRMIMNRTIDKHGDPVNNPSGYAEIRRQYKGRYLVDESYFNEKGEKINRIDYYFAELKREYDNKYRLIGEWYFDANKAAILSVNGYASMRCGYDQAGNKVFEKYFGVDDLPINNNNGYASYECVYDDNHNVINQRFLDASGSLVVTGSGYAEVKRTYEGKHLIREEYYGPDGKLYQQPAGHVAIEQQWDGEILTSRTYLDANNNPVNRIDGYCKVTWERRETYTIVRFYNMLGEEIPDDSINLARDVKSGSDGWSQWIRPRYNAENSCQNIGYLNLGERQAGDLYTCSLEIEFKNVKVADGHDFLLVTQGERDGGWIIKSIWNADLVLIREPPEDGVYTFVSTVELLDNMVNISTYNLGFRCDYWISGSYRIRNVKIQKNKTVSEWKPGV